ncbi:Transketolase [Grifola frondosa]|uniref:Transketolase n=1 Tax=Grifola frondosa TaxID=5627 RepID=A0A1C7MGU1_GRIFR|nr:Transketolase [Grifola frondosa]
MASEVSRTNSELSPTSIHPSFPPSLAPAMSTFAAQPADQISIAAIRALAADVVGKANSGHPGAPMGMAPVAHVLFTRFFNANPKNSKWYNRDRFVLSNGHGCALQYILLHLLGYKLTLDDLKAFRQLDSLTPGHPEAGHTDGVEVTTGPLGQGFSNAVGLAIAQAHMGATFNRDGFDLINNYTYVFVGDGCLMEGVTSEAASLAGHLKLGNLICVSRLEIKSDSWLTFLFNRRFTMTIVNISIDGDTAVAFTENVEQRFLSYDWQVLHVDHGDSDLEGIYTAIAEARKETNKPTIIRLRTTIGYGSKQQGTHGVHGAPLKADDIQALKTNFGLPANQTFYIPQETYAAYAEVAARGAALERSWNSLLASYAQKYPAEYAELTRRIAGKLPDGWEKVLPVYKPSDAAQASRKLSEIALTALVPVLPELMGGSADLTGSNLTRTKTMVDFQHESTGLGTTRERISVLVSASMVWARLQMACTRMAASFPSLPPSWWTTELCLVRRRRCEAVGAEQTPSYLGRDARLHRPRRRRADAPAHRDCRALPRDPEPRLLAAGRRERDVRGNLPNLEGSTIEHALRGGYIVHEEKQEDLTIVSSGSEVSIALEAAQKLRAEGVKTRVIERVAERRAHFVLEALSTLGWQKYSHEQYGLSGWGASGPYKKVYEKFGITGNNIAVVGKKVVDFYRKKGGEVISPLVKAL